MGDWSGTVPTFTVERARASKLQTLADIATALTGAMTPYTPTTGGITVGAGGVVEARYRRLGQQGDVDISFTLGTGSAVSSTPTFTLPFTPRAATFPQRALIGMAQLMDEPGTANYFASVRWNSPNVEVVALGTTDVHTGITSTVPFTWATTADKVVIRLRGVEIA